MEWLRPNGTSVSTTRLPPGNVQPTPTGLRASRTLFVDSTQSKGKTKKVRKNSNSESNATQRARSISPSPSPVSSPTKKANVSSSSYLSSPREKGAAPLLDYENDLTTTISPVLLDTKQLLGLALEPEYFPDLMTKSWFGIFRCPSSIWHMTHKPTEDKMAIIVEVKVPDLSGYDVIPDKMRVAYGLYMASPGSNQKEFQFILSPPSPHIYSATSKVFKGSFKNQECKVLICEFTPVSTVVTVAEEI